MMHQTVSRRAVIAWLAGGIGGLALAGCDAQGQVLPTYRYRLTVEVETPEGVRSGSSVIEVRTSVAGRYSVPTPRTISHSVRGEAATVDLGPERSKIFALLQSDDDVDWASNIFYRLSRDDYDKKYKSNKVKRGQDIEENFRYMLKLHEKINVPKKYHRWPYAGNGSSRPILVTFTDTSDPRSIIKLDPDNLEDYYGAGVKIKGIYIQMTNDPVSTGISTILPWVPGVNKAISGSDFAPRGIPVGDFQRLFERSY